MTFTEDEIKNIAINYKQAIQAGHIIEDWEDITEEFCLSDVSNFECSDCIFQPSCQKLSYSDEILGADFPTFIENFEKYILPEVR